MVIRITNNGREKPLVRLWHIALWSVLFHKRGQYEQQKERNANGLGKVGTDALLAVLFCFLLCLLKDELRYVAVEVFV